MFYTFDQNNSGGAFMHVPNALTHKVIIEADSAEEANLIGERLRMYFDGDGDGDCSCCGNRWYPMWDQDAGTESPEIYGKPVGDYGSSPYFMGWMGDDPYAYVHYADGRVESFKVA